MDESPRIEDLIEASSLGTPQAKALREQGKRLSRGEVPDFEKQLRRIANDFSHDRIDEQEAYERCLEIGCAPEGARVHVSSWASGR